MYSTVYVLYSTFVLYRLQYIALLGLADCRRRPSDLLAAAVREAGDVVAAGAGRPNGNHSGVDCAALRGTRRGVQEIGAENECQQRQLTADQIRTLLLIGIFWFRLSND